MSRSILILIVFLISLAGAVSAQTLSDEQRQRAERELDRLTPEEIQERLRQAGISQSEAIQRARAEGVSLEEYLGARVEREETRPDTGIRKPATPLPLPTRLPYRIR